MDIQFPVLLTLEEAIQGVEREFHYASQEIYCGACNGAGRMDGLTCPNCDGTGRSFLARKITASIPAGINDHMRIRITGQGLLAPDGTGWGDLYLVCYLRPHAGLKRDGFDLVVEADPLSLHEDGNLTVPTLTGPMEVQAPDECSGGEFRVAGLGLPRQLGGGDRGDLIVRLAPCATPERARALEQAKVQARQSARANDNQQVIALLGDKSLEPVWDAEAHRLLGIAYAQVGQAARAKHHMEAAVAKDPDGALPLYNLGLLAMQFDPLSACVYLEASLRRETRRQTRQALTHAIRKLFQQSAAGANEQVAAAMQEACVQAERRMYVAAASVLQRHGQGKPGFLWIQACIKLLACCAGNEELLPEAAEMYEAVEAFWPDVPALKRGRQALLAFAERDCGLLGLLGLIYREANRKHYDVACRLALKAIDRARFREAPPQVGSAGDTLARAQNEQLARAWLTLRTHFRSQNPENISLQSALLEGLIAQAECYHVMRRSGGVEAAWVPAIRAVQRLNVALSQWPDEVQIREQFQESLDLFNGIAGALMNDTDPHLAEFIQNTYDAAVQSLVPESPLNRVLGPGMSPQTVRDQCEAVLKRLFTSKRKPMRGEFLVAELEDHYALTNYRLYLYTNRLPAPQLLPLNTLVHYEARAEGLTVSTLLLGLSDGQQLALNGLANGTFPKDSLINYLVAAQMWERLKPNEQQVLQTGHADPLAVATRQEGTGAMPAITATAAAPTPALLFVPDAAPQIADQASRCPHCGNAIRPQDAFCRQCGTRLGGETPLDANKLIGSGG